MKRLTATVSSEAWKTRLSKGRSVEKSVKIGNYWRKKAEDLNGFEDLFWTNSAQFLGFWKILHGFAHIFS